MADYLQCILGLLSRETFYLDERKVKCTKFLYIMIWIAAIGGQSKVQFCFLLACPWRATTSRSLFVD